MEKSILVWLGPWKQKTIPRDFNATIETGSINIIGIHTVNDDDHNTREKLVSIKIRLNLWRFRTLTLISKIILNKAFGISNLIYSMSIVETPEQIIKESQQIINSVLYGHGPGNVKQKSLIASYEFGGLKSPDILFHIKELRIAQDILLFRKCSMVFNSKYILLLIRWNSHFHALKLQSRHSFKAIYFLT